MNKKIKDYSCAICMETPMGLSPEGWKSIRAWHDNGHPYQGVQVSVICTTPPSKVTTEIEEKLAYSLTHGEGGFYDKNLQYVRNMLQVYTEFVREETKREVLEDILKLQERFSKWEIGYDAVDVEEIKDYAKEKGINLSNNKN